MPIFLIAPIIGALIASALGGAWSSVQTIFQNQYNSPKSQLRRLRKAGLPLAYMYQGRVNQQSETPKLSIDPDLGTVEQKQLGIQEKLTDEQVNKLKEEIRSLSAQADIDEKTRDWKLNEGRIIDGEARTNLELELDWNRTVKEMDQFLKKNAKDLSDINLEIEQKLNQEGVQVETRRVAKDKIVQQIANMVKQSELMEQLKNIRGVDEQINKVIGDALENGDDWMTILYAGLLKLFSKL